MPVGYELPAAELSDIDDVLDMPSFEEAMPELLDPAEFPALELPSKVTLKTVPEPSPALNVLGDTEITAHETPASTAPEGLALLDDDSPTGLLHASARKVSSNSAGDVDEEYALPQEEVSFVVAARRKAFWGKPVVRVTLWLVLLAVVAGLALQIAVHERDRIAVLDERTRPLLVQLCARLDCQIAPPRQIADLVIDSSAFNKARGDSYQLAFTLKSKAALPLAMPAVELTLTDAQDQPVLRRVLQPADLGAPRQLPAYGEWNVSVSVIVTTGGARVAGYRLLAFYP